MRTNLMMQKTVWIALLFLGFISCDKDVSPANEEAKEIQSLLSRASMDSDGHVRTSESFPIEAVIIKKEGEIIAKTDKEGYFAIKDAELKEGDVLSFEHANFITVSKVLSADSKLIIWMKERAKSRVFDSREGGVIKLEKGGELNIPANAFSFKGRPYRGKVEITASYVDVTDEDEVRSAPGSYIAFDETNNNLVPLTSYGMVEVIAVIPRENQPLELSKGSSIEVAFPILTEDTPDTVNLYELDPNLGYWILQGVLTNFQNTLLGEITSVNSSWNADDPCSQTLICVEVEVLFQNGNPGCGVGATGVSYQGFDGIHSIGANNRVQLMVCPDSVFELGACWILCCGPGVPPSDPCCNNPQYRTTIDLSTVTINPTGCTDLGTWVVPN